MKPSHLVGVGLAVVSSLAGLWWLSRRPTAKLAVTEDIPLFVVRDQGEGRSIELNPPGPLRAVTWLRPLAGGESICFLSTQADQQLISLFHDGALERTFPLPLPEGVDAGFFRHATLEDAALTPQRLVLQLGDEDHPKVPGLLLVLDRDTFALRSSLRTLGQHLSAAGETLVLSGADTPLARLSLQAKRLEAKSIDLPPEVKSPHAVLALGPASLLIAHEGGVSALAGETWSHTPLPPGGPMIFPAPSMRLVKARKSVWWQPRPGQLFEIDARAAVRQEVKLAQLATPVNGSRLDLGLLTLLGADPDGHLWFGLSTPRLTDSEPAQVLPPADAGAEPAPMPTLTPEEREQLTTHLQKPLDRLYRFAPETHTLASFPWKDRWQGLHPPEGLAIPGGDGGLAPEGGAFLLGDERHRWWLSLRAFAASVGK